MDFPLLRYRLYYLHGLGIFLLSKRNVRPVAVTDTVFEATHRWTVMIVLRHVGATIVLTIPSLYRAIPSYDMNHGKSLLAHESVVRYSGMPLRKLSIGTCVLLVAEPHL